MRILVSSTPGAGHVFPMVPLVRALHDARNDVVWATGPEAHRSINRLGIDTIAAGLDTGPRMQAASAWMPDVLALPPRQRRPLFGSLMFGQLAAPAMASDLRPLVDREHFDLVLTEPLELAAPAMATARGIPHVTVGFGGLLPASLIERIVDAVRPVWEAEGLEVPADAGVYRHLYLHPFPPSLGVVPNQLPIVPARPTGFDGSDGSPPRWIANLGRGRPFVYVTFGTEFSPGAPFGPTLQALGKVDADAVLTVGRRVDPRSLPTVPTNVRVEQYVPQLALLDRASLVVSHAGSGTLLGAATRAIAQVCLPLAADQFDNADAVAAAGLGVCLDPDEVEPDSLASAITRLLDEPPTAATRRLADEIAAMPAPEELVQTITAHVDQPEHRRRRPRNAASR